MSNSAVFCRVCGRDHGLETACGGTPTFNAPIVTIPAGEPQNLVRYKRSELLHKSEVGQAIRESLKDIQEGRIKSLSCVEGGCERQALLDSHAEIIKAADAMSEAGKRMVAGQYVCPHAPCLCRFCAMRAALAQHAAAKGER